MATDPICRGRKEEEETAEHILRECPTLASYRGPLTWHHQLMNCTQKLAPRSNLAPLMKKLAPSNY